MYEPHRWNTPELVTEGVLLSSVNNRGAAQPLDSSNSGDIITLGLKGQEGSSCQIRRQRALRKGCLKELWPLVEGHSSPWWLNGRAGVGGGGWNKHPDLLSSLPPTSCKHLSLVKANQKAEGKRALWHCPHRSQSRMGKAGGGRGWRPGLASPAAFLRVSALCHWKEQKCPLLPLFLFPLTGRNRNMMAGARAALLGHIMDVPCWGFQATR